MINLIRDTVGSVISLLGWACITIGYLICTAEKRAFMENLLADAIMRTEQDRIASKKGGLPPA